MKNLRVHALFVSSLLLGLVACDSGGRAGADAGQTSSTGADDAGQGASSSGTGGGGGQGTGGFGGTGGGGGQGSGGSAGTGGFGGTGGGGGQGGGGPWSVCGDGIIEPGESCDDGPANSDTGPCTLTCKNAVCGDDLVLQGVEECDSGAANADNGTCTLACKNAVCGDGLVLQGIEQCDSGAANADNGACTLVCKNAVCGDGLVQQGVEQCDSGAANANDGPCTLACKNAVCGDGLVQQGVEQCDSGAANADNGACTLVCKNAVCGDGLVQQGVEECDSGAANANTGACTLVCKNAVCGDGLVRAGVESCDDGNAVDGDGCDVGCLPSGLILWTHVTQDSYASVALDASGNVFVTGSTPNGSTSDVLTVKYNPSGAVVWTSVYDGSGADEDRGGDVAVDSAGNPVVAGYETLADGTTNILVCKYDGATGAILWTASFDGGVNKHDVGRAIAVNAAGDIFITGSVTAPQPPLWDFQDDPDFFLFKLSGIDGSIVWSRIYGDTDKTDYGTDVVVDPSGNVLFGSVHDDGPSIPSFPMMVGGVGRYIDHGTTFSVGLGSMGYTDFMPSGIVAISASDTVVTGAYRKVMGPDNAHTFKFDATASQVWVAADQGPSKMDGGSAIAAYPNGDLIVVGYIQGVMLDWMVRKYSSSGAEIWTYLFNGAVNQNDLAGDVAIDAAGALYVVGSEQTASGTYLGVLRKLQP
jgi:cysteine-rich repeat protein